MTKRGSCRANKIAEYLKQYKDELISGTDISCACGIPKREMGMLIYNYLNGKVHKETHQIHVGLNKYTNETYYKWMEE